jgi:hypothetical protein
MLNHINQYLIALMVALDNPVQRSVDLFLDLLVVVYWRLMLDFCFTNILGFQSVVMGILSIKYFLIFMH